MASHSCDPNWHHDKNVPADYLVRRVVNKSGQFSDPAYEGRSLWEQDPDHTFACCRSHLETVVYSYTSRGWRVLVTALDKEK